MKIKGMLIGLMLLPGLLLGPTGCETMREHKVASGAAIGTAAGALAGGIIGHQSGHKTAGALIGAATGAALGGGIGYYLDRQAKKFEQIPQVEVEKVPAGPAPEVGGQPEPEHLTLRLSNDILFSRGSATLTPAGERKIAEIADILREYPDSEVQIKGYASAEGPEDLNLRLSRARADVVRDALVANRVDSRRLQSMGFGESYPLASNETETGRSQNRRVEIDVFPPEDVR